MLRKNLDLNPRVKDRIELVEKALWSSADENLYIVDNGPASFVTMEEPENYSLRIHTMSIDKLVEEKKLPKVDFIKLDIEGAEPDCLKGAAETIKKFRPKLAICIYHDLEHFVSIPKYIKGLVPESPSKSYMIL